jgi:hypothetical protein
MAGGAGAVPGLGGYFNFGCFFRFTVATAMTLVSAHCSAVEQLLSF